MKKCFWCLALAVLLCFGHSKSVNAADDIPSVVFTGETDAFVLNGDRQNLGDSFEGMLPGESRT